MPIDNMKSGNNIEYTKCNACSSYIGALVESCSECGSLDVDWEFQYEHQTLY